MSSAVDIRIAKLEATAALHALQIRYHTEELERVNAELEVSKQLRDAKKSVHVGTDDKKRRVYVDGCFDIMHCGHYNALRQAKMLIGSDGVLVAGVHSSKDITAAKGPPVFTDEERLALVRSCKFVDEVVFGTPYTTTLDVMDRPDVNCFYCAHGDDLAPMYLPIKEAGRLLVVKRTEGTSTTDLVGRLLLMSRDRLDRRRALSVDHSDHSPEDASGVEDAGSAAAAAAGSSPVRAGKMAPFLPTSRRIAAFGTGRVPKPEDRIVYMDGSFDMMHPGHAAAIKFARSQGDFLYLGIHDDGTISDHWGSSKYPIMNLHERCLCALANKHVDEIVIGAPWEVSQATLEALRVSVVVDGGVVTKFSPITSAAAGMKNLDEARAAAYAVPISRDMYVQVESNVAATSLMTSEVIVDRILTDRAKYEARNAKKVVSENAYMEGTYSAKELADEKRLAVEQ